MRLPVNPIRPDQPCSALIGPTRFRTFVIPGCWVAFCFAFLLSLCFTFCFTLDSCFLSFRFFGFLLLGFWLLVLAGRARAGQRRPGLCRYHPLRTTQHLIERVMSTTFGMMTRISSPGAAASAPARQCCTARECGRGHMAVS